MNSVAIQKIDEGAYFVIDTLAYINQITAFDLTLATQTISSVPSAIPAIVELPEPSLPAED